MTDAVKKRCSSFASGIKNIEKLGGTDMNSIIKEIEDAQLRSLDVDFKTGDTIKVSERLRNCANVPVDSSLRWRQDKPITSIISVRDAT